MFLIIGFVRRRELSGRNDALDPHALSREQFRKKLGVCPTGKIIEQIDHELCPRSKQAVGSTHLPPTSSPSARERERNPRIIHFTDTSRRAPEARWKCPAVRG